MLSGQLTRPKKADFKATKILCELIVLELVPQFFPSLILMRGHVPSVDPALKQKVVPTSQVPDGIPNLAVVDSSTSWLQFKWDEPSENPTCVLGYNVCVQDVKSKTSQCSPSEDTSFIIRQLQPCSTYNVSVQAKWSEGLSSPVYSLSETHEASESIE
ncbi:hypothetical protein PR048_019082 [Dryococelus australis]|uniref:Fibronectin type-III domain-containing protein n=1 Tax=Dryococelus australis TaxID=614101 RepID=A0ABQ9H2H3_9NEOP|nr:hypothetical protein PR048_019082 [Dryococelus australis]